MNTQTKLSPNEKKIRMAMENTWEKNINPKAVPELLEALKKAHHTIELLASELNYQSTRWDNEHIEPIRAAISKATI